MVLASDDDRLGWSGVDSVVREGEWSQPWRVDDDAWLRRIPLLRERAGMPAGVRWEMILADVSELSFEVEVDDLTPDECSPIDVQKQGEPLLRIPLRVGINRIAIQLEGIERLTVWWPQYGTVRVGSVHVSAAGRAKALVRAADSVGTPRWTAYGSSITQCRTAPGPTETWPALVASNLGWDLLCLGFGGQAHLDQVVARSIRDAPADIITLCVGVNIQGAASLSARTLGSSLAEFIRTIRDGQPLTPIVVISPICCPDRDSTPNAVGLTLGATRAIVNSIVEDLQDEGDMHLGVVDGLTVLGSADASLLADGLHPDPGGYRLMAERLAPILDRERRVLNALTDSSAERIMH